MLEKPVTDVVLQPNELSGEAISDKQSEFDINCKVDGKIANIEMIEIANRTICIFLAFDVIMIVIA